MAVSLTANMSARSITVTVSGLSEEHTGGRTFTWTLDDGAPVSDKVYSAVSSYSHTFQKVRYAANHTITVRISDIKDAELYYSGSVQVADALALWSWTESNGDASAEQVKAAYKALTENSGSGLKGLTTDFSRVVWNDLADSTSSALAASGLSWDAAYSTLAGAKMTAADDALTAEKFNSISRNLRYPWMYWSCKPERTGYTGRLDFSAGDAVYGAYLLELAHALNVLVDALGAFGAGYATLMDVMDALRITTTERLRMRSPQAVRCASPDAFLRQHGSAEMLAFLCRQNFVTETLPSVTGRQAMVSPRARRGFLRDVLPSVREEPSILSVPACIRATTTDTIPATTHDDSVLLTRRPTKMLLDDYLRITSAETILMQSGRPLALALTDQVGRVSGSLLMVAEKVKRYLEHSASLGSYNATMVAAASGLLSIVYDIVLGSSLALSASPSGILLMDEHFGPRSDTAMLANPAAQLLALPHFGPRSDTRLFPSPTEMLRVVLHFGPGSDSRLYPSPSSLLRVWHHPDPVPDVALSPDAADHLKAWHHPDPVPTVALSPDAADHLVAQHHPDPVPDVALSPDAADHLVAWHHPDPAPDVALSPDAADHLVAWHHPDPVPDVALSPDAADHLVAWHHPDPVPDVALSPDAADHLVAWHHPDPAPDVALSPDAADHLEAQHNTGPSSDSRLRPIPSEWLKVAAHFGPSSATRLFPSPSELLRVALHFGPSSDAVLRPTPSEGLRSSPHEGTRSNTSLYPSLSELLSADNHTGPSSDTELHPSPSELLKVSVHLGPRPDVELATDAATYLNHIAAVLSNMGAAMETEYRPGDTVTDDLRSVANAILRWAESVHMQHTETSTGRLSGTISLTPAASLPIQDGAVVGRIWSGSILPMESPAARKMHRAELMRLTRQELLGKSPAAAKGKYVGRHGFVRQELPGKSPTAAKGHHRAALHLTVGADPVLSTPKSALTVAAGMTDYLRGAAGTSQGRADPSVYVRCAWVAGSEPVHTCTMATFQPTAQVASDRPTSSNLVCLETTGPSKFGVTGRVNTTASAALETERVGADWIYPVERGTDLLIQQAKVITDRGTDLLIQ